MTNYKGYFANIEAMTVANTSFRNVVYTGAYSQLVLMSLKPGEEIGKEKHGADQFFRIEAGTGKSYVDNQEYDIAGGNCVIVPAGAMHNIVNTGSEDLKLYTIYSIPNHIDGENFVTKAEAEANDKPFDGRTTESQA